MGMSKRKKKGKVKNKVRHVNRANTAKRQKAHRQEFGSCRVSQLSALVFRSSTLDV